MYHPTTRLLTLLELLQARGVMSGRELAQVLEVEERSVRRYVMMLRDMGIPVEGERGRHGGYTLRPGFRLPPLMFSADEITAITVGLKLMREFGYASGQAIESASAKIDRVLPDNLRHRADAVRESLRMNAVQLGTYGISNAQISLFSLAIYERHCLDIEYIGADGSTSERRIAPYGLVLHFRTWYIPAYCCACQAMRIFRLDRVRDAAPTNETFDLPASFDPTAYVLEALARLPGVHTFDVILEAPLATVRELVPASMGLLEPRGDETHLRCYADDPDWFARYLVRLGLPFRVEAPDALRAALRTLADDLMRAV